MRDPDQVLAGLQVVQAPRWAWCPDLERPPMKNATRKNRQTAAAAGQHPAVTKNTPPAPVARRPNPKRPPLAPLVTPVIPEPDRPSGKLGLVLDAVAAVRGASLGELVALTGWQPHTTRAALCRLRQRGFDVALREIDGRRAYQRTAAATP